MRRVLFVDDEQNILDGLERTLRPLRKEWEMVFSASGPDAIEEAEKDPFEIVVTDMRMPGMDGADLLEWFHDHQPQTIRFMLSGQADAEAAMRAMPIAHQFLSKPCNPGVLKAAVARAVDLGDILSDSEVQTVIGAMSSLPSRPTTYTAILQALADPDVEIARIAEILESDSGMSVKVLQLANSALFGAQQNIADVSQATGFLGINTIRDLVLSIEVFQPPANCGKEVEQFIDCLQRRSTWTGSVARRICKDRKMGELAFTAGVLHDIGMLVLATKLPEQYSGVLKKANEEERPVSEVEAELLSVGHESVGAYLLGVWGLPYPMLDIAANHDQPAGRDQTEFSEVTAVHVASALVESKLAEQGAPFARQRDVDLEYLEAVGVADRLDDWQEIVDEDASAAAEEAESQA